MNRKFLTIGLFSMAFYFFISAQAWHSGADMHMFMLGWIAGGMFAVAAFALGSIRAGEIVFKLDGEEAIAMVDEQIAKFFEGIVVDLDDPQTIEILKQLRKEVV